MASPSTPTASPGPGFSAEAEIGRKAFGVDFNVPLVAGGLLLADKVKIELDIQIVPA